MGTTTFVHFVATLVIFLFVINTSMITKSYTEVIRPMGVEPPQHKYRVWEKKDGVDVVCCVCDMNKQLTEILTVGGKMVSHGYCQEHFKEEIEKVLEWKKERK